MSAKNHKRGQRYKEKIKKILQCRQGVTLVELIVTFALIGLFAMGTSQLIGAALKSYHQTRGLNNAQQVSDTLMDKITGVIAGAKVDGLGLKNDDGITLRINADGTVITLYARTGSPVHITAKKTDSADPETAKRLVIHYYELKDPNASDPNSAEVMFEEVDWVYDKNVYMGFAIKSLTFAQANQSLYPPNIIKVDMELTGEGYGVFHTTRYVECYNFATEDDWKKIEDESGGGEPEEPEGPVDPGGEDNPPHPEEQDDFVKAVGDCFLPEDSWKPGCVTVGKEEVEVEIKYKKVENKDNPEKPLVIVKKTEYKNNDQIDKDIIENFVENKLHIDDDDFELIYIDKDKFKEDVDDLVEALGFDDEEYEIKHLYFDPKNGNLMAMDYKHNGGKLLRAYYGSYTEAYIKKHS